MEREFPCQHAESEDSADVGAIGLALEPLAWWIRQPEPGESLTSVKDAIRVRGARAAVVSHLLECQLLTITHKSIGHESWEP